MDQQLLGHPRLGETLSGVLRRCLCKPIDELKTAARLLDEAANVHLASRPAEAEELIREANIEAIWHWTDSIWGKQSAHVKAHPVENAPTVVPRNQRPRRMPTREEKEAVLKRDGYHCRFCGIPVIPPEVRQRVQRLYPQALQWGRTNKEQHAAFQAMWLQFDHLVPHSRGGTNSIENLLITCAPCNFGRMQHTLEEVNLENPLHREPVRSEWDGLKRFMRKV